jgi:hypothetical protein
VLNIKVPFSMGLLLGVFVDDDEDKSICTWVVPIVNLLVSRRGPWVVRNSDEVGDDSNCLVVVGKVVEADAFNPLLFVLLESVKPIPLLLIISPGTVSVLEIHCE